MKVLCKCIGFFILVFYSSSSFSQNTINFIILPDPLYAVHHIGFEMAVTEKSRLGMLAAYKRDSDRPTYGESNDDVTNTFSRILIPWIYSKNGAWEDGFILTGLVGLEKDKFKSEAGSRAEATFVNFGLLAGYQWFWGNGFNISAMAGGALLVESRSEKGIIAGERSEVVDYLDKNTKTNTHFSAGVILGWAF
jgi:hypothetical protein